MEKDGRARARGFTVWFTGLSGSGKTTVARLTAAGLRKAGLRVEVLDGDEVRRHFGDLGFSHADRDTNVRRIGYVAMLLTRNGAAVLVAAISPYRQARAEVRAQIQPFIEVYMNCPLQICMERDVKGLYRKALAGEIPHFTGVSDPYEAPLDPEIAIPSHLDSPQASAARVMAALRTRNLVPTAALGAVVP